MVVHLSLPTYETMDGQPRISRKSDLILPAFIHMGRQWGFLIGFMSGGVRGGGLFENLGLGESQFGEKR